MTDFQPRTDAQPRFHSGFPGKFSRSSGPPLLWGAARIAALRHLRRGGGARDILAPKGIAILYSEIDRDLMLRLGLTFGYREFLSVKPTNVEQQLWLRESGHID